MGHNSKYLTYIKPDELPGDWAWGSEAHQKKMMK
jgi:hypothetical protein